MKRRFPYILALFAILGLGAFGFALAQSFFTAAPIAAEEDAPREQMIIAIEEVINGERTAGEVRVTFAYPDWIPAGPPAARGLFLAAGGNELTLGTGSITVEADVEVINDGDPVETINAVHGGADVSVQYSADTRFFLDTSDRVKPTTADIEAGSMLVERTLVAGTATDIGENMMVRVWGTINGDVVEADIVVYAPIR